MSNNILTGGELYDSETGELINEVEQIEVEVIENTLPDIICNGGTHIRTNTIQLKQELAKLEILKPKSNIKYGFSIERSLIILMYQDRYKICKELEEKRK